MLSEGANLHEIFRAEETSEPAFVVPERAGCCVQKYCGAGYFNAFPFGYLFDRVYGSIAIRYCK